MTTQDQLDALGMTRRGLGRAFGCSATVINGWCADGAPPQVQAWLTNCIATRPVDWRRPIGRPLKPGARRASKSKEDANG